MSKTTLIIGAFAATVTASACNDDHDRESKPVVSSAAEATTSPSAEAKPARVTLPAPFTSVYLGMPRAELLKAYEPEGKIDACQAHLLGPKTHSPEVKPKPHARCATVDVQSHDLMTVPGRFV